MNPETDYIYHKQHDERGIARCITVNRAGIVSYFWARKEDAGKQIAWRVYPNGERLPIFAVKHSEGDSFQAMGIMRRRAQEATSQPAQNDYYGDSQ